MDLQCYRDKTCNAGVHCGEPCGTGEHTPANLNWTNLATRLKLAVASVLEQPQQADMVEAQKPMCEQARRQGPPAGQHTMPGKGVARVRLDTARRGKGAARAPGRGGHPCSLFQEGDTFSGR
jgi:hypothetical protein